jgi:hypothetical protein
LTVENIGPGPRDIPALSLCHYGEQNGDAMRDPEMCFEMEVEDGRFKEIHAYYYRNDYYLPVDRARLSPISRSFSQSNSPPILE